MYRYLLSAIVLLLALIDGAIHLGLDVVVFHSHFLQNTLSELFLLNFVGYLALLAVFLRSTHASVAWRRAVDVVMIGYAAVTFVAWISRGEPNPHGLGYVAKAVEALLVVALIVHASTLGEPETPGLVASR